MMTETQQNSKIGDAAVDGLLAGLGAGVVMGVYLLVTGIFAGEAMGTILGRFAPGGEATPLTGVLSHLAVSAIYGAMFGVMANVLRKRVPIWAAGLVFGLGLFMIAQYALLPGTGSALLEVSPVHFGIAHGLYGGMLGWQVGRRG
ncbi:MAG: hypothetical protein HUU38_23870 [Anaerolineales bacterium]|nr:hypothetical protein [Anaerolineales bacterium]